MANGLDGTYVYQHTPVVYIKETTRPPVLASCVRGKPLCGQQRGRSSGYRACGSSRSTLPRSPRFNWRAGKPDAPRDLPSGTGQRKGIYRKDSL